MEQALLELSEYLSLKLADALLGSDIAYSELTIRVRRNKIVEVLQMLHDDSQTDFINLTDLAGVDFPGREERFEVVYHLLSPTQNTRLRVKVSTDEDTPVPSVTGLFPVAEWYEREAYDLYGIYFSDHPDLRRILTDYGFSGHPLRKDFPLTGYVEVRYDEARKRVVYEPVKLPQEFRDFDYLSPWEGTEYVLPGDEKAQK